MFGAFRIASLTKESLTIASVPNVGDAGEQWPAFWAQDCDPAIKTETGHGSTGDH